MGFAESAGLLRTFPAGERFWRGRACGAADAFDSADALGTPPPEHALSSNRMSPAGIPAFYGADDLDTVIDEILTVAGPDPYWSAGEFATSRDCILLDLASMPEPPSIFDVKQRPLRRPLCFLAEFADDISKPLGELGREHIDYVPTQVVAEFLRLSFQGARLGGGCPIPIGATQGRDLRRSLCPSRGLRERGLRRGASACPR
jgi:RES domain